MEDVYQIMKDMANFEKEASKQIYLHREDFQSYVLNKKRLDAVRDLKEYTGGTLKQCLDVINLYIAGKLKSYIIEERKDKLKQLGKSVLIDNLILNIKKNRR